MSDSNTPDGKSDLRSAVEANAKKKRGVIITIISVVAVALIAGVIGIVASLNNSSTATADAGAETGDAAATEAPAEPLKVRIATAEDTIYFDAVKEVAAEKGLEVEWVNVDDWVLPNTELVAGSVDANAFQHILYLSAFNAENDADLTPVFSTVIVQWGLFSATLDDIAAIPDGGKIAIPDDVSNGGRALFILEAAGLLELADDAGDFPNTDDITANPKNLEIIQIGARTIPQQFDDPSLSAVVVGTSYFDPTQNITPEDALFLDDALAETSLPYVNVIAVRGDDTENPAWKILEEAYADPRVAAALEEEYFGTTIAVNVPVKKLQDKLTEMTEAALAG